MILSNQEHLNNLLTPGLPNNGSIHGMEHTKIYPFTVCLPRYASWRKYVRTLLNQLKSCPNCKAAADGLPISVLPKRQKLSNGKILIFRGPTSASDQGPGFSASCNGVGDRRSERASTPQVSSSIEPVPTLTRDQFRQSLGTIQENVEEYDLVSVDPNCPKHGKYSRTAWLQKQRTKLDGSVPRAGVKKVGPRQQMVSRAKDSKNHSRWSMDKRAHKTDGIGRSISSDFWKPLDKFYLQMMEKDVVEKQSGMAASVLKKRKGENFELDRLKQSTMATANMTANESVLVQKQLNVISMDDQKKDLLPGKHSYRTKSAEKPIMAKLSSVLDDRPLEFNELQISAKKTTMKMRVKCEISSPAMVVGKDLRTSLISEYVNKVESESPIGRCGLDVSGIDTSQSSNLGNVTTGETKISEEAQSPTQAVCATEMATTAKEKHVARNSRGTAPVQELDKFRHKLEPSKDLGKGTYASQYRRMCQLKGLYRNHVHNEAVDRTEIRDRNILTQREPLERPPEIDIATKEKKSLPPRGCLHQNSTHVAHEPESKGGDESTTSTLPRVPKKVRFADQVAASEVFAFEKLEQTREQLKKITNSAKTLRLGMKDYPACGGTPAERVHLTQVQFDNRIEIEDWLPNMAIERATSKLPEVFDGGRVRLLVQAFESIK